MLQFDGSQVALRICAGRLLVPDGVSIPYPIYRHYTPRPLNPEAYIRMVYLGIQDCRDGPWKVRSQELGLD